MDPLLAHALANKSSLEGRVESCRSADIELGLTEQRSDPAFFKEGEINPLLLFPLAIGNGIGEGRESLTDCLELINEEGILFPFDAPKKMDFLLDALFLEVSHQSQKWGNPYSSSKENHGLFAVDFLFREEVSARSINGDDIPFLEFGKARSIVAALLDVELDVPACRDHREGMAFLGQRRGNGPEEGILPRFILEAFVLGR